MRVGEGKEADQRWRCARAERPLRCISVACHMSMSPTQNGDSEVTTGGG
jgi:hypothetical protein